MSNAQAGLSLMVWSCDLAHPERAATPFMVAQAAWAMDIEVEMLFTAQAVQWLLADHGETLIGFGPERLTVRHYLETLTAAGVQILACSQALHALGMDRHALSPHCTGLGGTVAFVGRTQDTQWRTLVF